MKLKTFKKMCLFVFTLVSTTSLFAQNEDSKIHAAQQPSQLSSTSVEKEENLDLNTWDPYLMDLKNSEPRLTTFVDLNVGIGFLYFAGIRGNMEPNHFDSQFDPINIKKQLSGRLNYNRTPLIEAVIGTSIFNWWKIALSYQHQGEVIVTTTPKLLVLDLQFNTAPWPSSLTANVNLDAVMLKTYFMLPYTLVLKNLFTEPYLGLAIGPGWQTWNRLTHYIEWQLDVPYRQKISANCVFSVDLGFKLRKAVENYILSFTCGCKYNQWGQARSMGKLTSQAKDSVLQPIEAGTGLRAALINPLRIKTVYQFAPYIGMQLNF